MLKSMPCGSLPELWDNYRLEGCTLYVTLELALCAAVLPCTPVYRAWSMVQQSPKPVSQVLLNLFDNSQLNHASEAIGGVLAAECVQELQAFFEMWRLQHKASKVGNAVKIPEKIHPWPISTSIPSAVRDKQAFKRGIQRLKNSALGRG
jgi:hypothetical protein